MAGRIAYLKHEGEVDGHPFGPVTLAEDGDDQLLGRPYRPRCGCEKPSPEDPAAPESDCTVCGGLVVRWFTYFEAVEFAAEHDAELQVT